MPSVPAIIEIMCLLSSFINADAPMPSAQVEIAKIISGMYFIQIPPFHIVPVVPGHQNLSLSFSQQKRILPIGDQCIQVLKYLFRLSLTLGVED